MREIERERERLRERRQTEREIERERRKSKTGRVRRMGIVCFPIVDMFVFLSPDIPHDVDLN